MVAQPDSVLSATDAFSEIDQARYNFGHDKYVLDGWNGILVRTELNSVLENVCAALKSELGFAFDQRFGTDENEWRELNVLKTMKMIVAQASSRFIAGLPLCMSSLYSILKNRTLMNQAATKSTSAQAAPSQTNSS
jgi:hypothetical protein